MAIEFAGPSFETKRNEKLRDSHATRANIFVNKQIVAVQQTKESRYYILGEFIEILSPETCRNLNKAKSGRGRPVFVPRVSAIVT